MRVNSRNVGFRLINSPLVISVFVLALSQFKFGSSLETEQTYDFIVVGSGPGGSCVAGRLAETGLFKVLLIEAGGIPEPEWSVPALGPVTVGNSSSPRSLLVYQSVPQRNVAQENNGTVSYVVGKTLGGSSTVNGMQWNRGHPHDFNNWARYFFDDNWSYTKLLTYFKKSENYTGRYPSAQHGVGGPITVSASNYMPGLDYWLEAGKELGYPTADPNGPQMISFAPVESSRKEGRRVSSYNGYIEPLLSSGRGDNLHILINTEATKILFEGKRAVGVEYRTTLSDGKLTIGRVHAKNEIIVSAGVIGSPVLLMKSGIGPRAVLNATKIPVVQYLPAGKNLQDHLTIRFPVILTNGSSETFDPNRDLTPEAWEFYERTGDGPYSIYSGTAGQAYLLSSIRFTGLRSGKADAWPDIQLQFYSSITPAARLVPRILEQLGDDLKEGEVPVMIEAIVVRPQSRGTVKLDPTNIENPPLIDFRFLSHPSDLQIAMDGIKASMKIVETSAFKRLGARLPAKPLKECREFHLFSEEYWRCYIRQVGTTNLHGAGTCRMGEGASNSQAVVDTQLRVIGVEGLRVVDASIMPFVVNANTQAAVYAISEYASELIINFWKLPKPQTTP